MVAVNDISPDAKSYLLFYQGVTHEETYGHSSDSFTVGISIGAGGAAKKSPA
jgi:hypothetical protein